jgi:hypothetical protein
VHGDDLAVALGSGIAVLLLLELAEKLSIRPRGSPFAGRRGRGGASRDQWIRFDHPNLVYEAWNDPQDLEIPIREFCRGSAH